MTNLHCRAEGRRRIIEGIAVPWDQTINVRGRSESFAPGSVRVEGSVPLRFGHQGSTEAFPMPIGSVTRAVDSADGLWIETTLVPGEIADHAWEVARAEIVQGFSIEFTNADARGPGAQGRVTDARLRGVALTERPAYPGATVMNVRARTPELERWLEEIETLRR